MNLLIHVCVAFFAMVVFLLVFFPLVIQVVRGGWWYLLAPLVFVFGVIDIFANYTVFCLLTLDIPKKGEWTFSARLERLCLRSDWRGDAARRTGYCLNAVTPEFDHIENAKFFRLTIK